MAGVNQTYGAIDWSKALQAMNQGYSNTMTPQQNGIQIPFQNNNAGNGIFDADWTGITAADIPRYTPPSAIQSPLTALNNTNSVANRATTPGLGQYGQPFTKEGIIQDLTTAGIAGMTGDNMIQGTKGTPSMWDSFTDNLSWDNITSGIQSFGTLMNGYLGYKGLGLAEDQFAFRKNAYEQDYQMRLDAYNTNKANQEARTAQFRDA